MNSEPKASLARSLGAPAAWGAALYSALFAWCLAAHGRFSILGVQDQRLARVLDLLERNFAGRLVLEFGVLLLAYAAIGAALAMLLSAWSRRPWIYLPLLAAFHGLVTLRAAIRWPQLFAEFWYQPGGWRADAMVWLTGHLSPMLPGALALALVAATLLRALARLPRRPAAAMAAALVLGGGLWLLPRRSARANAGPNLLILAADSLRPDRLGAYGYARDTSPAIDELARRSSVFRNVYVPLPRTFQSWATLLTGTWPPTHGLRSMFPTFEDRAGMGPTMMHDLAAAGWRTAVVSDFAGDIFPRADYGFQEIRAPGFDLLTLARLRLMEIQPHLLPYLMNPLGRRLFPILREFAHGADPEFLADEALEEIARLSRRPRFALAVFFSTTHFPYAAPYPYYARYADPAYRGPFKYHKFSGVGGEGPIGPADKRQVSDLFDGAVRATDDQIGRILRALDDSGLARNTIVVVTGDHGENIYDRPDLGMDHGNHLRARFSLTVPLILRDPLSGTPPGRIGARVREVDLAPTLLRLLGRPPMARMEGEDLAPWMRGERADDLPVYLETGLWYTREGDDFFQKLRIDYPDVTQICETDPDLGHEVVLSRTWQDVTTAAKHRAWIEDGWKLIEMPTHEGLRRELYDLAHDPDELADVAAEHPEVAARLADRLLRFLRERPRHVPLETAVLAPGR